MDKVAIGVSCGEVARYSIFYDSLMHVDGVNSRNVLQVRGANIAENRNLLTQQAIDRGFDAIWYVDDDQVFAPNTLRKLMAHDKDIVSGLYLNRQVPFVPHMYDQEDKQGFCLVRLLQDGQVGLVNVKATGAGCLLVKVSAFEKIGRPWWRLGQITKDGWGDDLDFCRRARSAGLEIWCDQDCVVGHQMQGTIWPVCREGKWSTIFVQNMNVIAEWPPAQARQDGADN